jgi:phosphoglycolate phosphatase
VPGPEHKPFLIFDLDGTLVDSLPGIAASLNRSLQAHGMAAHSDQAVRSFVGDGLAILVRRAAPAGTLPETLESLVRCFKADYAISWRDGSLPFPGVPEMLEDLQNHGIRMAVLSNKVHSFTVEMVAGIFPAIAFTTVLGQQDGVPHKPDPAGALQIAAAAAIPPAECVVIGDSTMDVETATRAGMRCLAVSWGYHDVQRLLDAGATNVLHKPADCLASLAESGTRTRTGLD